MSYFLAVFGWPGLAAAVCGAALALRLLKRSMRPGGTPNASPIVLLKAPARRPALTLVAAGFLIVIALAVRAFWPSDGAAPDATQAEITAAAADNAPSAKTVRERRQLILHRRRRQRARQAYAKAHGWW